MATIDTAALREQIANNHTAAALDTLYAQRAQLPYAAWRDEVVQLRARQKAYHKNAIQGLLAQETLDLQKRQINHDFLDLLQRIDRNDRPAPLPTAPNNRLRNALAGFAAVIAVLAGIAELTGYSLRDIFAEKPKSEVVEEPTELTPTSTTDSTTTTITDTQADTPDTKPDPKRTPPTEAPKTTTTKDTPAPKPPTTISDSLPPKLAIQLTTNHGNKNLRLREGETLRLSVQANRPCTIRSIYALADSTLVLLANDLKITSAQLHQPLPIGEEFEVAEPFGAETLYVFAQNTAFPTLKTEWVDGYEIIHEGLPEALQKTRGLKKKRYYAEARIAIETTK